MNVLPRIRLPLRVAALMLAAAATLATTAAGTRAAQTAPQPNQVLQWNQVLLGILHMPGAQPATIHATRNLAILHAAIYDAVNAIERTTSPYLVSVKAPRRASIDAAAAAAAHRVLVNLYPSQKDTLDAQLAAALTQLPNSYHKDEGVRVGDSVADAILALRGDDGSNTQPPAFTPETKLGDYQPTPPAFAQPVFTHWPFVRPFTLTRADQFRPDPPPALGSSAYRAAFAEVRSLGAGNSTTRTADQTQIAQFWSPPIWVTWNEIAQTAALAHHDTLAQDARLFALLNLSFADSAIAFYDAKYAYHFWRPVTAIRATADPSWTPLTPTAPDPSYPGAHSTISSAAATVLAGFFGRDDFAFAAHSDALPGVQRSFTSFSAAADEAGLSRIYAGQHFRTDHIAGQQLGTRVATHVLQNVALTPRREAGLLASPAGALVAIAKSPLGRILIDSRGRTIYLFEKDRADMSACSGSCASFWPPVITSGKAVAGAGVKSTLLGTIKRSDGRLQVTYNHHPLYTFKLDTKAGQTTGQGSNNFGAKWYVVSPSGSKIDNTDAKTSSTGGGYGY
jgi:predicted lipoprotein with Yx(FWY)xxD motif/membrane-associated phospholipid phosphatase